MFQNSYIQIYDLKNSFKDEDKSWNLEKYKKNLSLFWLQNFFYLK